MQIRVNVQLVPSEKIFPNVWNPNRQSEFMFQKAIESIKTHGFLDPILVREIPEGFEIIDGEHRWKAAKHHGLEQLPVNNLGSVSDSVAKQLTILMNEVRGKADTGLLSDLMKDISDDIGEIALLELMPFSKIEIDSLINMAGIDFSTLGTAQAQSDISEDPNDWETVAFKLPPSVACRLREQIVRIKALLSPGEKPDSVSPVAAIESLCDLLIKTNDDDLI